MQDLPRAPLGVCYTRTGRNFFNDEELERAFIERVHSALTNSGFWETMNTDWVCLDAELMPWSVKAQTLVKDQYASVGAAASASEVRNVAKRSAVVRRGFALANRLWPRPPMTGNPLAALLPPPETASADVPPLWLAQLYGPHRTRFSAAKAGRVLGWSPRVDLAAAQAATVAWLVENGRLPPEGAAC